MLPPLPGTEYAGTAVRVEVEYCALVTDAQRLGKAPVLFYLFAEPASRCGVPLSASVLAHHRAEVATFAAAVDGDEVTFRFASYGQWLGRGSTFPGL